MQRRWSRGTKTRNKGRDGNVCNYVFMVRSIAIQL